MTTRINDAILFHTNVKVIDKLYRVAFKKDDTVKLVAKRAMELSHVNDRQLYLGICDQINKAYVEYQTK